MVFVTVPAFPLLAELSEAESVTPIVSHDEPGTDRMSSCERNLTHLCVLPLHKGEGAWQNSHSLNKCQGGNVSGSV